MNRFLIKSWVYPFYKTYAGFLFVIFLIAVGILRGEEHITLGFFFTSHIKNILYPLVIFVLYELLTIHFSIKWISNGKNRVIREVLFLNNNLRFRNLILVVFYLHIPVVIYTFFLIGISFVSGQFLIPVFIFLLIYRNNQFQPVVLDEILLFTIDLLEPVLYIIHIILY